MTSRSWVGCDGPKTSESFDVSREEVYSPPVTFCDASAGQPAARPAFWGVLGDGDAVPGALSRSRPHATSGRARVRRAAASLTVAGAECHAAGRPRSADASTKGTPSPSLASAMPSRAIRANLEPHSQRVQLAGALSSQASPPAHGIRRPGSARATRSAAPCCSRRCRGALSCRRGRCSITIGSARRGVDVADVDAHRRQSNWMVPHASRAEPILERVLVSGRRRRPVPAAGCRHAHAVSTFARCSDRSHDASSPARFVAGRQRDRKLLEAEPA